jgi:predicted nucleic acid-binding protein
MTPPTPLDVALAQVDFWLESPTLKMLGEGSRSYWTTLQALVRNGNVVGPRVHDARVASIALQNGCSALYTADRDFNRFPQIKVVNPLV